MKLRGRDVYPAFTWETMKEALELRGLKAIAFRPPEIGEYFVGRTAAPDIYVTKRRSRPFPPRLIIMDSIEARWRAGS